MTTWQRELTERTIERGHDRYQVQNAVFPAIADRSDADPRLLTSQSYRVLDVIFLDRYADKMVRCYAQCFGVVDVVNCCIWNAWRTRGDIFVLGYIGYPFELEKGSKQFLFYPISFK